MKMWYCPHRGISRAGVLNEGLSRQIVRVFVSFVRLHLIFTLSEMTQMSDFGQMI